MLKGLTQVPNQCATRPFVNFRIVSIFISLYLGWWCLFTSGHWSCRGDHRHDVLPTTVGPHRQPAADHLAHRGDVGGDPEVALGTAVRNAEAGHHLIEDQQGTVLGGQLAQANKELLGGGDEAVEKKWFSSKPHQQQIVSEDF